MSTTGSTVTTKPDWNTRDPQAAEELGRRLATAGYVIWQSRGSVWIVLQPGKEGTYHRVHVDPTKSPRDPWWVWLMCDCNQAPGYCEPCVHKAAVVHETKKPSPYRMYHEGY